MTPSRSGDPDHNPGPSLADKTRLGRYVVAAVVLVVAVLLALVKPGLRQVCNEQVTEAGETIEACAQAGPSSLQVLLVLAVLLLLFLPDLSEVGFAGVTVKRAIADVKDEVEQAREDVERLPQRIAQVVSTNQSVSITQDNTTALAIIALARQLGLTLPDSPGVEPAAVVEGAEEDEDVDPQATAGRLALTQAALTQLLANLPEPWRTGRLVVLLAVPGSLQPALIAGSAAAITDEVISTVVSAPAGPVMRTWQASGDGSPALRTDTVKTSGARVAVAAVSVLNASSRPLGVLAVLVTLGPNERLRLTDEANATLADAAAATSRAIVDVLRFETDA